MRVSILQGHIKPLLATLLSMITQVMPKLDQEPKLSLKILTTTVDICLDHSTAMSKIIQTPPTMHTEGTKMKVMEDFQDPVLESKI